MKNAIRYAMCLAVGATSIATYAGEGYEATTSGNAGDPVEAQPSEAASGASMDTDDGHGSGEPMRANADTSADARGSEKVAIDDLNRERLNRENWAPAP